jgi:hypothetical protein
MIMNELRKTPALTIDVKTGTDEIPGSVGENKIDIRISHIIMGNSTPWGT